VAARVASVLSWVIPSAVLLAEEPKEEPTETAQVNRESAKTDGETGASLPSRYTLEQQMIRIAGELSAREKFLKQLESACKKCLDEQAALKTISRPVPAVLEAQLKDLRSRIDAAITEMDRPEGERTLVPEKLSAVSEAVSALLASALPGESGMKPMLISRPSVAEKEFVSDVVDELREGLKLSAALKSDFVAALQVLDDIERTPKIALEKLNRAKVLISDDDKARKAAADLAEFWNRCKTQRDDDLKRIATLLEKARDVQAEATEDLKKRQKETDELLSRKEGTSKQRLSFDFNLIIIAIIGLLATLALGYLLLNWFPDRVVDLLIERRTFLELTSFTFLLGNSSADCERQRSAMLK